jgi:RNA polymerase sigma factor (sigma-70 family)
VSAGLAVDDVLPALYARLRGRLGRLLYRHRIPPEDAEDLVQTTLMLAVAKWHAIREPEAWLLGTLHKRCIVYWRARVPQREHMRQLEELDLERAVESDQNRRDWLADLDRVWHHLSPKQQTLLTLRFREGLTSGEAAGAVGLAASSERKTTLRALARLREALSAARAPEPAPRQRQAGGGRE